MTQRKMKQAREIRSVGIVNVIGEEIPGLNGSSGNPSWKCILSMTMGTNEVSIE